MCKRAYKNEYIPIIWALQFFNRGKKRMNNVEKLMHVSKGEIDEMSVCGNEWRKKVTTAVAVVAAAAGNTMCYVKWKVDQGEILMKNSNRTLYLLS